MTNEYLNQRRDIMNRVNDKVKSVTRFKKRDRKANLFYEPQPVKWCSFMCLLFLIVVLVVVGIVYSFLVIV